MRGIVIGLALALVAPAASAQTQQQHDWCYSDTATDDETIDGCTALIQSPQESPATKAEAYDNRGYAYKHKGLYDQAIADETQSLALNANSAIAYNTRGLAYSHKGLYDQAIADYNRSIALKPDYAHAYYSRATAFEMKGLRDPAIADYRASSRLDPNDPDAPAALKRLGATP
jgi:tetratricopeptide (TPR) repeat protein